MARIGSATFVLGVFAPLAAFAELSNDPLLGPGLRWRGVRGSSHRTAGVRCR